MKQVKKLLALVMAVIMVAALGACGANNNPPSSGAPSSSNGETSSQPEPAAEIKVGLIANVFGTASFNDDVLAGVKQAETELGVGAVSMEVPEVADTANAIRTLIAQGVNFMVIPSSEYKDGMMEVAEESPEVKFLYLAEALTDTPANVMTTGYKENEAAFLAGALGGLMTKTNKIGAVMAVGESIQYRYQFGYMSGAKAVNPNVEVQTAFTNSYADVNKGQEVAKLMYAKGCDYVGTYAGACNLGVFNAAKEAGPDAYVFGAANGQFDKMPEKILASVVKPVNKAIYGIIKEYKEEGKFDTSAPRLMGLKEAGVTLLFTDNAELLKLVPADKMDIIKDLEEKVKSGEIVVPQTEEEYKAFTYSYAK